jgi:hypothetical protein
MHIIETAKTDKYNLEIQNTHQYLTTKANQLKNDAPHSTTHRFQITTHHGCNERATRMVRIIRFEHVQ